MKPATLLKLALLHGYFSRSLNCTNGTKSHNANRILQPDFTLEFLSNLIIYICSYRTQYLLLCWRKWITNFENKVIFRLSLITFSKISRFLLTELMFKWPTINFLKDFSFITFREPNKADLELGFTWIQSLYFTKGWFPLLITMIP